MGGEYSRGPWIETRRFRNGHREQFTLGDLPPDHCVCVAARGREFVGSYATRASVEARRAVSGRTGYYRDRASVGSPPPGRPADHAPLEPAISLWCKRYGRGSESTVSGERRVDRLEAVLLFSRDGHEREHRYGPPDLRVQRQCKRLFGDSRRTHRAVHDHRTESAVDQHRDSRDSQRAILVDVV